MKSFLKVYRYIPDLYAVMSFSPWKFPELAEQVAEGLLKAGCPGKPFGFWKIYVENRLNSEEIRIMPLPRKETVFGFGEQFWIEYSQDSKARFEGFGMTYNGTWWIEEDMLCLKWKRNDIRRLRDCGEIYRNPASSSGSNYESLIADTC